MPLTSGTRLGPYEILEPIGAGGMGEVYKARDTRLDRTVAVKVSSERFSERFEREARAVAALNHPLICTLHDVGLTPRLYAPHEYETLWANGIGLTDIAKFSSGMDHQLPRHALGKAAAKRLRDRILAIAPRHLAFTSLKAGRSVLGPRAVAGEQKERLGDTRVWLLPSPSPLAANHWDIAPWAALAQAVKRGI